MPGSGKAIKEEEDCSFIESWVSDQSTKKVATQSRQK